MAAASRALSHRISREFHEGSGASPAAYPGPPPRPALAPQLPPLLGSCPGSHVGRYLEFASHRTGASIDRIESVMWAKSTVDTSSVALWYVVLATASKLDTVCATTPIRASWMLSDRLKKPWSGCGSATSRAPCFARSGPSVEQS